MLNATQLLLLPYRNRGLTLSYQKNIYIVILYHLNIILISSFNAYKANLQSEVKDQIIGNMRKDSLQRYYWYILAICWSTGIHYGPEPLCGTLCVRVFCVAGVSCVEVQKMAGNAEHLALSFAPLHWWCLGHHTHHRPNTCQLIHALLCTTDINTSWLHSLLLPTNVTIWWLFQSSLQFFSVNNQQAQQ